MLENKILPIKISVISNIIFEPHFIPLMTKYFRHGAEITPIPYGEHNDNEYVQALSNSNLIVVWLNYESLFPDISNDIDLGLASNQQAICEMSSLCEQLFISITQRSNAHILWFSFENYYRQVSIAIGHGWFGCQKSAKHSNGAKNPGETNEHCV